MPDFIASSINSKIKSPLPSRNVRARLKRNAKEFSQQKICLRVPEAANNGDDEQQLNIPRARLTREFVQGLIKEDPKSGEKHVVQYLASNDKDGAIVQLDRMQTDCRAPPTSYKVVTKVVHTRSPPPPNHRDNNPLASPLVVHRNDGQCIMHTRSGTFSGEVDENDEPSGFGELKYRDGDCIKGTFRKTFARGPTFTSTESKSGKEEAVVANLERNPYAKSEPHGAVKVSFADGSIYEGEMTAGHVTGYGVYVNAIGDRQEGAFKLGLLTQGKIEYASGEVGEGNFKEGESLHGLAKWSDSEREISGHFENGVLNGKATVVYRDQSSSRFHGFFHQGRRHRHGVLNSGPVTVEGPWLSDSPLAGGRARSTNGKSWPTFDGMKLSGNTSTNTAFHVDERFVGARAIAIEQDTIRRMSIREKNCRAFDKAFKRSIRREGGVSRTTEHRQRQ